MLVAWHKLLHVRQITFDMEFNLKCEWIIQFILRLVEVISKNLLQNWMVILLRTTEQSKELVQRKKYMLFIHGFCQECLILHGAGFIVSTYFFFIISERIAFLDKQMTIKIGHYWPQMMCYLFIERSMREIELLHPHDVSHFDIVLHTEATRSIIILININYLGGSWDCLPKDHHVNSNWFLRKSSTRKENHL